MVEVNNTNGASLLIDGTPFFIRGVGGTSNLAIAKKMGANTFKTWEIDHLDELIHQAEELDLKVMVTFHLEIDNSYYMDEQYKAEKIREMVETVQRYRTNKQILIWNLGNELNLGETTEVTWNFIEEAAQMIRSIDQEHPVTTVIAWADKNALNSIAKCCPSIHAVGINAYAGYFEGLIASYKDSEYYGPLIMTEWGTLGHWEVENTAWGAPIEPTGEKKLQLYIDCYDCILKNKEYILGSFVFYWGQKQERTQTWYSMFAEQNIDSGLHGEPLSTVLLMERLWKNETNSIDIFEVDSIRVNNKNPEDNLVIKKEDSIGVEVHVKGNYKEVTYRYEIVEEEEKHGVAGSYTARPKSICKTYESLQNNIVLIPVNIAGNFRIFVYAINEAKNIGVANFPFRVEE